MAIEFPASPTLNDTFTQGSITYTYDGDKWIGLGVTPTDRLLEGSNSLEINANNDLVWTGSDVGLGISSPLQQAAGRTVLTINGTNNALLNFSYGETLSGFIYGANDEFRLEANGTNPLVFRTDGGTALTVTAAGLSEFTASSTVATFTGNGIEVNNSLGSNVFIGTQSGSDGKLGTKNNSQMSLFTNSDFSKRATLGTNGDFTLNDGNFVIQSGHGISFINAPDISIGEVVGGSVLEDYEEGTFTPTVSVEGQGSNAATDKQYGRYVKVGKMVTVWCYVQLNGTPAGRGQANAWQHGGLPFRKVNNQSGFDIPGSMIYWTIDDANNLAGTRPYMLVPRIFNNTFGGRIRAHSSDSNQSGQNASLLLKDNTEYSYTFTYETE